jgi:hypothetical protein
MIASVAKPMAAGSTHRRWTVPEVLSVPLPPVPCVNLNLVVTDDRAPVATTAHLAARRLFPEKQTDCLIVGVLGSDTFV